MKQQHLALNYLKMLWGYHAKKLCVSNYPVITGIEATSACNLSCPFCARSAVRERGIGYMTEETFNQIVCEENRDMLRHIRLFMHGEPLMHPRIVDFVQRSAKYAKTVGFSTNGVLMNRKMAEDLIKAGLTTVSFSFEGTSRETYEHLRRGANYDKVHHNILQFLILRNTLNPNIKVSMAIIDMPETHKDLPEFLEYWRSMGVDNLEVLQLHDWGGIHDWNNASETFKGTLDEVCLWPWFGCQIRWNGDVAPCCVWEQPSALGNINNMTMQQIWNDPSYIRFRQSHLFGRMRLYQCQTCKCASQSFEPYLRVKKPGLIYFTGQVIKLAKKRSTLAN